MSFTVSPFCQVRAYHHPKENHHFVNGGNDFQGHPKLNRMLGSMLRYPTAHSSVRLLTDEILKQLKLAVRPN